MVADREKTSSKNKKIWPVKREIEINTTFKPLFNTWDLKYVLRDCTLRCENKYDFTTTCDFVRA